MVLVLIHFVNQARGAQISLFRCNEPRLMMHVPQQLVCIERGPKFSITLPPIRSLSSLCLLQLRQRSTRREPLTRLLRSLFLRTYNGLLLRMSDPILNLPA